MAGKFASLPGWSKGTVAVLVTSGAIVGIYYGIKGIKKLSEKKSGGTDPAQSEEVKTVEDELQKLNKNSSTKQRLTNSQALSIANTIDSAMQDLGTDEQTIKDQFYRLYNNADFLAVQKSFGKRLIRSGSVVFADDLTLTLIPALRSELDSYWIGLINEILKKKNIKYRV